MDDVNSFTDFLLRFLEAIWIKKSEYLAVERWGHIWTQHLFRYHTCSDLLVGCLEKKHSPNGGLMVMNPMVESVKHQKINKHKDRYKIWLISIPWKSLPPFKECTKLTKNIQIPASSKRPFASPNGGANVFTPEKFTNKTPKFGSLGGTRFAEVFHVPLFWRPRVP